MDAPHEFRDGKTVNAQASQNPAPAPAASGAPAGLPFSRQFAFWLAALVAVIVLLWLLSGILLPFVAGFAIAYLLRPLTDRIERLGVNRVIAALFIIALVVLALRLRDPAGGADPGQPALLLHRLRPRLCQQAATPAHRPEPALAAEARWAPASAPTSRSAIWSRRAWAGSPPSCKSLWSGGRALVSLFSLMVVTPVVAFYLLNDWHRMVRTVDGWIPVHQRDTVHELAREIDATISGFVRGQSMVCVLLGLFYAVALTLAGLNFGLLIGLLSGSITFIPYVGSMTGLVLAVGVAVAQFWPNYTSILIVLGVFLVGQFLEGNVLSPKLVGESVGLHPVWIIFALLAFGYLFGFVGLMVAVPMAATIGVLARFALRRYLQSSFYTGEGTP